MPLTYGGDTLRQTGGQTTDAKSFEILAGKSWGLPCGRKIPVVRQRVGKKHCFLLSDSPGFPDPPASASWVLGQAGTITPGGEHTNKKEKWEC